MSIQLEKPAKTNNRQEIKGPPVLMTGDQYRESLRCRRPMKVYLNGEKVENILEHPIIKPSINTVALTYDLAHDPEQAELMTTESSISGHRINRFCHLHQSTEDLVKKVKMQRMLGGACGTCFQRCVGMDAINATFSTSFEIDEAHGTNYHERFKKFVEYVQHYDLIVDGCMTDVKGDRSKRPADQEDPDMYVRVVERRDDGIVINVYFSIGCHN